MKIYIEGTGSLKQYVPDNHEMDLSEKITLGQLRIECNIPDTLNCGYMVNGRMQRQNYFLEEGDKLVFMSIVKAG